MPTTPESMKGMVAVSEGSKIKPLGYLTWFSVPDESIGLRKLKATLAMAGLPPTLAPKDNKAINTFKRAMREQEGRRRNNGHITDTAVAMVVETPEDCVYQISREVRDLDERLVEYAKAMTVTFSKKTDDVKFKPLGGIARSDLMDMELEISTYMDQNSAKVTGAKVRSVVRNYLRSTPDEQRGIDGLSGENLRGKAGGIYFIPAAAVEELTAMSEALSELYPGRAYLHAIPMADNATEREIIRAHHIANTRQEMKEAMAEVKGLLSPDRDRAPRSDSVAHHWARFNALQRRAAQYAEVLEDEQDEIREMGEILKKQLDRLI